MSPNLTPGVGKISQSTKFFHISLTSKHQTHYSNYLIYCAYIVDRGPKLVKVTRFIRARQPTRIDLIRLKRSITFRMANQHALTTLYFYSPLSGNLCGI